MKSRKIIILKVTYRNSSSFCRRAAAYEQFMIMGRLLIATYTFREEKHKSYNAKELQNCFVDLPQNSGMYAHYLK